MQFSPLGGNGMVQASSDAADILLCLASYEVYITFAKNCALAHFQITANKALDPIESPRCVPGSKRRAAETLCKRSGFD